MTLPVTPTAPNPTTTIPVVPIVAPIAIGATATVPSAAPASSPSKQKLTPLVKKKWAVATIAVVAVVILGVVWLKLRPSGPGAGFVSGNGRVEATEIDIATKLAGRVQNIMVDEGDFVRAGQMLLPVGFINEAHEPPAFLGSRRPLVEQTLIPTTWHENGVGLHGDLPGSFSYRVYLVNGMNGEKFSAAGIQGGRQFGKEAKAQSLAWTGRLDWSPLVGATAGVSFYTGNSNQTGTGEALTTTLWDVHAEYRNRGLQVRGLYTRTTLSAPYLAQLGAAEPALGSTNDTSGMPCGMRSILSAFTR